MEGEKVVIEEDKMLRTWYLILKTIVFCIVVMGIYFLTHFSLGVVNGIDDFNYFYWEMLLVRSSFTFILSLIPYSISLFIERLTGVKYKIAKKIRIIEPIIYLILSIVFTLGFMYNIF
ncbi:MAG: hypothetical protein H6Q15_713 [Bacteroidetes bacterium]|nr:hypothetical protein [Bacteroidota bacterium]